jgi:hypothetical protein
MRRWQNFSDRVIRSICGQETCRRAYLSKLKTETAFLGMLVAAAIANLFFLEAWPSLIYGLVILSQIPEAIKRWREFQQRQPA